MQQLPWFTDERHGHIWCVQVIFVLWSVLPPSTWFKATRPDLCLAMFCLVFALTLPPAWLHGRVWCIALNVLEAPSKHVAAGSDAARLDDRGMRAALQAAGKPCGMRFDGMTKQSTTLFYAQQGVFRQKIMAPCAAAI